MIPLLDRKRLRLVQNAHFATRAISANAALICEIDDPRMVPSGETLLTLELELHYHQTTGLKNVHRFFERLGVNRARKIPSDPALVLYGLILMKTTETTL